jgi:parallel beta-helix repeat protein
MRPRRGVRIIGEGYGSHIRSADGMNRNLFILEEDHIVFENVRIDGNGANQGLASGNCIYVDGTKGCRVSNCWVHESPGYNIVLFPGSTHCVVENNFVYDSREEGIELQGASYCTVVGNDVFNCQQNGILLWNSAGVCAFNAVVGNTVRGSGGFGIQVTDNAHDNTITGNTAAFSAVHGIAVNAAGPNVLSSNVARSNAGAGLRIDHSPNCMINDNLASDNSQAGVLANGAHGVTISGNNSYANKGTGIDIITSGSYPVVGGSISGNVCSENGQDANSPRPHGISLRGPHSGVVIQGNRCFDSQSSKTQKNGIAILDNQSTNVLIDGNVVEGNAGAGLFVDPSATGVTVTPIKKLKATIGASQTAVPHGMSYAPQTVSVSMTSAGTVWRSAASDSTNVYLRADGPGRTADLTVG